jgi:hypothetical protein
MNLKKMSDIKKDIEIDDVSIYKNIIQTIIKTDVCTPNQSKELLELRTYDTNEWLFSIDNDSYNGWIILEKVLHEIYVTGYDDLAEITLQLELSVKTGNIIALGYLFRTTYYNNFEEWLNYKYHNTVNTDYNDFFEKLSTAATSTSDPLILETLADVYDNILNDPIKGLQTRMQLLDTSDPNIAASGTNLWSGIGVSKNIKAAAKWYGLKIDSNLYNNIESNLIKKHIISNIRNIYNNSITKYDTVILLGILERYADCYDIIKGCFDHSDILDIIIEMYNINKRLHDEINELKALKVFTENKLIFNVAAVYISNETVNNETVNNEKKE